MDRCVEARDVAAALTDKTHVVNQSERIPAVPVTKQREPNPKNPIFESIRTAHKYLSQEKSA